jgi:hypothetical protein
MSQKTREMSQFPREMSQKTRAMMTSLPLQFFG